MLTPNTRWGSLRLHVFHRGDMDRDPHDHPMNFWTLPLNTYFEAVMDGRGELTMNAVKAFCLHHREARYSHRVVGSVRGWLNALPPILRGTCYAYWGSFALKARDAVYSPALALSSRVAVKRFAVQAVPRGRTIDPKICRAAVGTVEIPRPRTELETLSVTVATGAVARPMWLEVIFGGRPRDLSDPLNAARAAAKVTVDGIVYSHLL